MTFPSARCSECGKVFVPVRRNNIRCSAWCRELYKARHDEERYERMRIRRTELRQEKVCRHCGMVFKPVNPRRVFCSSGCRARFAHMMKPVPKQSRVSIKPPRKRIILPSDLETDISAEIRRFKKSGGKITVLPAEVQPAIPSVGVSAIGGCTGSEWSASALAGLGEYEDLLKFEEDL